MAEPLSQADSTRPPGEPRELVFRRRHRITLAEDFTAARMAKLSKHRGPLTVFLQPNTGPEHRLGLGVGRRVGNAVQRGRIKRLIREAFRHERANLPDAPDGRGYDIVVSVRPHRLLPLARYQALLVEAVRAADKTCRKRHHKKDAADG